MEIVREFLVHLTLVRDGLALLRKGPTAWTVRGEDFVTALPHYRQFTEHIFTYANSVAQGPPEHALETCRNVLHAMDMFHLMSHAMAKKRPTIHERLERIAHLYEQVRSLNALADVSSPRPDGKACGTDLSVSRFQIGITWNSARGTLQVSRYQSLTRAF